jgi:hypothetical protein
VGRDEGADRGRVEAGGPSEINDDSASWPLLHGVDEFVAQ